jgi:hypothetical protein
VTLFTQIRQPSGPCWGVKRGVLGPETWVTGGRVPRTYMDTTRLTPTLSTTLLDGSGFGLDFVDTFRDILDPILICIVSCLLE